MDAKTRHELKQNDLAEIIGRLRDWDNPATRYTLLGIVVIALVFAGWRIWSYNRQQAQAASWVRLMELNTAISSSQADQKEAAEGDLRSLMGNSDSDLVTGLAAVRLARAKLTQAQQNPDLRQTLAEETISLLTPFASPDKSPTVEAPARFALASAYEYAGDFDKAREQYEALRDEGSRFAGSPYVTLAAGRLSDFKEVESNIAFLPGSPPEAPPVVNGPAMPDRFALPPGVTMPPTTAPAGEPQFLQELQRSIPADQVHNPPPIGQRLTKEEELQQAEETPEEGVLTVPEKPGEAEPQPAEPPQPPTTQPSAQ